MNQSNKFSLDLFNFMNTWDIQRIQKNGAEDFFDESILKCIADKSAPKEISHYPCDPNKTPRYINPFQKKSPNVRGVNLSEGFQNFTPPLKEKVYNMDNLKYVVDTLNLKEKGNSFVSLRKSLRKIMEIPVNSNAEFVLELYTNEENVTYIIENFEDIEIESHPVELQKLIYSGFKYEEIMTQNHDYETSFHTLVSTNICNQFNIYLDAEVDACLGDEKLENYVELKTHPVTNEKDYYFWKKLTTSYIQTSFIATKLVSIGFRRPSKNGNLILKNVKHFNTGLLPQIIDSKKISVHGFDSKTGIITCYKLKLWYKMVMYWLYLQISRKSDTPRGYYLIYDAKDKSLILKNMSKKKFETKSEPIFKKLSGDFNSLSPIVNV